MTHLLGVGGEFFKLNVMKKLLPLLLILVGCQTINLDEEKAEQWQITYVEQGERLTTDSATFVSKELDNKLEFKIKFNETMKYEFNTYDQFRYNHLFGISYDKEIKDIHYVSIGWRWNKINEEFDIVVLNSWRNNLPKEITKCNVSDILDCKIEIQRKEVLIIINGKETYIDNEQPFINTYLTNLRLVTKAPQKTKFEYIIKE